MKSVEQLKREEAALHNPETGTKRKTVLVADIIKKELNRCRFKDTDKNVLKIISRYKGKNLIGENKARKIIHSIIMTNTSILEK